MIFHGTDEQTVEFRITNYEFPDNIDGDWDSNWLLIYLNVKSKIGQYSLKKESASNGQITECLM